jgi:hypothetical protein
VRLQDVVAAAGEGTAVVGLDGLATAGGDRVVLTLATAPVDLPTGRVVDAVVRSGRRIVAVVAVEDEGTASAVVLDRAEPTNALRVLPDGVVAEVSGPVAARLDAEAALEAALGRERRLVERDESGAQQARARAAEDRVVALEAERAALTKRVADLTRDLKTLRTSRAYGVGQAFGQVRQAPVRGLVRLPGRLLRAGKSPSDQ